MAKKILFSPIGGTDPIKFMRDGSMLHICRVYQPDVVYLYLSHEMAMEHDKDNRYVACLERLREKLQHEFQIQVIRRDNLTEVQEYDIFYEDFRKIIAQIEQDMEPEDELLVNMASGTPAMKSALLVMATLAEYRFHAIQVSTPQKRRNSEHDETFDIDLEWELDEDNAESFENRCSDTKCMNLVRLLKIDMIKKHLAVYQYNAALNIAEEMPDELSMEALELLKIADMRERLMLREIAKQMGSKAKEFFPIQDGDKQQIFEYLLGLKVKMQKAEYADFVRGITPVVVDLMARILKLQCGVGLEDCCDVSKEKIYRWSRDKLAKRGLWNVLESAYSEQGGFRGSTVYSAHIAKLIEHKCQDEVLVKKVQAITEVESAVRNVAAHDIVSVTDEWIQHRCGKSTKEIFELLKYLTVKAGIPAKTDDWDSYDTMNRRIVASLDMP